MGRTELADLDLVAAKAAYDEHGWWASPVVLSPERLAALVAASERVAHGTYATGRKPILALPLDPGPADLRKIDQSWWSDPDLAALATDPLLGAIASALMGCDEVRLWQDQLLYKPPGGPATTTIGWHQDWDSWKAAASHPGFVTAWVAFDDVDDSNGAMQMLLGSHRWGLVEGKSNFFATDRDAQLDALGDLAVEPTSVVLQAGQVSFHHPLTFHGSGPNTSDRMRRSLAIHYMDGRVTAEDREGLWQHYNLAAHRQLGGRLGEPFVAEGLCPVVA
jgi:ectoine hydroxylase-related dioxygenase (phytanoyl-CoA dioxygenase family)